MTIQVKIDIKDAKILKILLNDSRTSFTQIAKECQITVGAVRARYTKLKQEGIIKAEIMQINPRSLGYNCVADLGIITAFEDEKEVAEFLKSKSFMPSVYSAYYGKYNLATIIVLPNVEKLTRILELISVNQKIKRIDAQIWTETKNIDYPENLIIKPLIEKGKKISQATIEDGDVHLDEKDRYIIKTLSNNSRTPFSIIAKQLGVSTKNVIEKYMRLKGKVLTFSTISLDLTKLGYKANAHLFIKASRLSKMPQIQEQILQIPNIIYAVRLMGTYDMKALIALEDYENLFDINKQLRKIQGIEQSDIYPFPPFTAWPPNIFASLIDKNTDSKESFK